MDSFRITLPQHRSTGPALQFPLCAGALPRVLELHYHFSYTDPGLPPLPAEPDGDTALAIDELFEYHLNRQAMLCALALLRGDEDSEQVW